jgi:class 3 adenylate cyclase/predicted ATPase
MKCVNCGFDNPRGTRFCGGCGRGLSLICTACGAANPGEFRFCGQCGKALSGSTAPTPTPLPPASPRREAVEHRQLTVLFCDLARSTALSRQLDPEDYGEVIRAYRAACAEVVERHGGSVMRYLGDGLLIAFGYPRAREDDARRGARAALEIADRVPAIDTTPMGLAEPLAVRIGINTGPVVAGDLEAGQSREHDALIGETLNVAARLQGLAELNTVVVSNATLQLIEGGFDLVSIGLRDVKGVDAQLHIHRLLREKAAPEQRQASPLPAIVGRARELEIARERWRRAEQASGQFILVNGEPGIGKSRLIAEIEALASTAGGGVLRAYCAAYTATSALHPFVELLLRHCGIAADDDGNTRGRKVEAALAATGLESDGIDRLGLLLDLPPRDPDRWRDLSPNRRRQETFDGLLHWLQAMAARHPTLLIVEDLHWADDSTLDLLEALFLRLRSARLMIVCSARPEFRLGWPAHPSRIDMTLDRLSDDEVQALLAALRPDGTLPVESVEAIRRRADGIPLFVNELARSMADQPNATGPSSVPASLRDLLRARIDSLDRGRGLLQYAAALGQFFTIAGLAAVLGSPTHALQDDIDYLMRQGFLEDAGVEGGLRFHHALLRDEVYETTLRTDRRRLHAKIADAIARAMPDALDRQPEVLATHLAQAGRTAEAIAAWRRAGRRASERSANVEAVQHFRNALALLDSLPVDAERDKLELALQVSLGGQLIATRGNAAPEVEAAYTAAERLCRSVEDRSLLFRALRGLQTFAMVRGRVLPATEIGRRLIELAREDGDPGLLLQAHRPMGLNLLYCGRYDEACEELDRALRLYDPDHHRSHRFDYGSDPAVLARCNAAWAHWLAGRPVTGLAEAVSAVNFARRIDHPHSLAFALSFLASVQQCRNDAESTLAAAAELSDVAALHVFPYWASWADALGGWAQGQGADVAGGARRMAVALESYRQTGAELMRPYFLGLLADVHLKAGMAGEALVDLAEAIDRAHRMGINFYLPELLRLQAVAYKATGAEHGLVTQSLSKAMAIAEAQGSGSWRLRCLLTRTAILGAHTNAEGVADSLAGAFPELKDTAEFQLLLGARSATAPTFIVE